MNRRSRGSVDASARGGFTLLELLLALAIFSVLALVAWGGLSAVTRQTGAMRAAADRLATQQQLLATLRRDLEQAMPGNVRGAYGETLPALVGGETGTLISNLIAYHMQKSLNWNLAAALATLLLAGVLILYWVYNKLVGVDNMKLG